MAMLEKKTVSQCISADYCRGWNDAVDAMPRWIPVEMGLPKKHKDGYVECVLVTDGYIKHMAYFANGAWYFCDSGEMKAGMFYKVTHWMPLPESPKEDLS
jgi:hypothetical protein